VAELVSSRYGVSDAPTSARPMSWDDRVAGFDVIRTTDGHTLKLASDGQQSPPDKGWIILLSAGDLEQGYRWTLYGLVSEAHAETAN